MTVTVPADVSGDILVWSFPALDKTLEGVLKNRSGLVDVSGAASAAAAGGAAAASASAAAALVECPYRFSKFGAQYLYQLSAPLDSAAARARKVVGVSVGVLTGGIGSAGYFPAKYNELCKILLKAYTDADPPHSPIPLMQIYLSVLTTNSYSGPFGSYAESSFDPRRAMIAPLKYLVQSFGAASIDIWIAMLLKKRVFVYHPRTSEVMNLVKIFPLLGAWHRQDVSLLRPLVTLSSPAEMADLTAAGVYVAGLTDPDCINKKDMFDLCINAETKTFTWGAAGAGAGEDGRPPAFALTKFHRTTAEAFATAAATETDQGMIKLVAQTTKEFLDKLAALKAEDPSGVISQEGLAAAGLPQSMQTWIYAVAQAEGLTKK